MDSNNIKITPKWSKTKEQIWAERFEHLADKPKPMPLYRQRWFAYSAAAVVLIAVVLPVAAYIYKTQFAPQPEQTVAPPVQTDTIAPAAADYFDFTDAPLDEVLSEIELQYSVKIVRPADMNHRYTGRFSREYSVQEVLEIVGEPFNIELKTTD